MKLVYKREDLLKTISVVQGITSGKTTMPILNNILFKALQDKLNIAATDLEVTAKYTTKINVLKTGETTIPGKRLLEILKELPEKDITIDVDEKNKITIICDKIVFKLNGLPSSDFPELPNLIKEEKKLTIKQNVFKNMIKKTIFAASQNDMRYNINGVYFTSKSTEGAEAVKEFTMVATNGHILAFVKEKIKTKLEEKKGLIVPLKVLNELLKNLEEDEKEINIGQIENQIVFNLENIVFTSRLIDGEFPNYEQIIDKPFDKKFSIKTETFLQSVKRIALFASSDTNIIKVTISKDKLKLSSTTPDVGEAEEELEIKYSGPEVIFGFNARYLLDIIKNIDDTEIEMNFIDSTTANMIKPVSSSNYFFLIMPVRI